ncbi:hypothetical protein O9992_30385 [Vibrio lentus]|nr:hypothetical protein [Vibrio lentus]
MMHYVISLVVVDAIVVVENTFRHLEDGTGQLKQPWTAHVRSGSIIAMTITLAAVYA